ASGNILRFSAKPSLCSGVPLGLHGVMRSEKGPVNETSLGRIVARVSPPAPSEIEPRGTETNRGCGHPRYRRQPEPVPFALVFQRFRFYRKKWKKEEQPLAGVLSSAPSSAVP